MAKISSMLQYLIIGCIRIYQWLISPITGPHCRFTPSCSAFAIEAIQYHGIFVGFWLTLKRLARCHPGCPGGFDPVPQPRQTEALEQ